MKDNLVIHKSGDVPASKEARQMLHDLQAHQIELERQNAELRHAQAELESSRSRYFDLYNHAPVGYFTISEPGLILEANSTAANLLGLDGGALLGHPLSDFIIPEDQDVYFLCRKQLNTAGPAGCELRLKRNDGTHLWARLDVVASHNPAGGREFRLVLIDITERKFHKSARRLAARLIELVNATGDLRGHMPALTSSLLEWSGCDAVGIRLRDGDDYPYYATRGFPPEFFHAENSLYSYDVNGQPLRDEQGKPLLDCMCGNVLCGRYDPAKPFFTLRGSFWCNSTTALIARNIDTGSPSRTRNRCNSAGYESVALIPLRAAGRIIGLVQLNSRRLNCFTPDLIAQFEWMSDNLDVALSRRKAEDALKEQERQYRLLFDSAGDSIFIHDAKQRLLAVNHAAYERLGYTHDELVSLSVNQIDSPVHAPSAAAGIEQLMKHGHLTFETEHRHKDGSMFPTEVVARRIIWNGEPAMMSVCRDVTKAKQEAHALRQAKDRADEANLAKSQYLASMSHELRTPLNPILGFADLLAEATNLTDEQRVWLKIISQRGHDLLQLIGNVLDLAKIEADKIVINPEPLLLRQVVGDVSDSSRPAAMKKGLALEWNVAEDIPDNLLADGFRLRQILLNLLNNAIKFTKNGGITLHVQDGRTARLVREPATGEAALLFSVRDTGIGITADRQADIFEPFTQADSKEHVKYEGVGLGLAIVRRLVELSGGRIWVASEPGKGSTFWFTLVVGVSSTTQRQESGKPYVTPAAALIPLNILIVDDDPASLEVETVIVQRVGHRVQTATDGQQALTLMKSQAFDLVLMDETMPVMDGMESTRRIREWEAPLGRHTRIVALTASAIQGDRARLREGGMDAYLAKPILAAALRDALHGRDTLCA